MFIKVVGSFTNNILTMVPKDRDGNPIDDLSAYRVDADPNTPGVQEMKDWTALMEYVASFPDTDGDGVPNIPDRYQGPEGRFVKEASYNPVKLLAHGNYLTWIALGAIVLAILIIALVIWIIVRIVKKRKARKGAVKKTVTKAKTKPKKPRKK
jgi:5'-nucleotidase/UDP-sugar diphosphatase